MAKIKTRHDMTPLVKLIKTSVRFDGGRKFVKDRAQISESTYASRNRTPDEYQLGELIRLVTAYRISMVDLLLALVSVFDIPSSAVNVVAVLMQEQKK